MGCGCSQHEAPHCIHTYMLHLHSLHSPVASLRQPHWQSACSHWQQCAGRLAANVLPPTVGVEAASGPSAPVHTAPPPTATASFGNKRLAASSSIGTWHAPVPVMRKARRVVLTCVPVCNACMGAGCCPCMRAAGLDSRQEQTAGCPHPGTDRGRRCAPDTRCKQRWVASVSSCCRCCGCCIWRSRSRSTWGSSHAVAARRDLPGVAVGSCCCCWWWGDCRCAPPAGQRLAAPAAAGISGPSDCRVGSCQLRLWPGAA